MTLRQIWHNTEYMRDNQPGMTIYKFEEFLTRIPYSLRDRVDYTTVINLFSDHSQGGKATPQAMHEIIKEIIQSNRGAPSSTRSNRSTSARVAFLSDEPPRLPAVEEEAPLMDPLGLGGFEDPIELGGFEDPLGDHWEQASE